MSRVGAGKRAWETRRARAAERAAAETALTPNQRRAHKAWETRRARAQMVAATPKPTGPRPVRLTDRVTALETRLAMLESRL